MPWTRRHRSRLPKLHLAPQLELNTASVHHDIVMLKPILLPGLAIDLDTLHIIAVCIVQILSSDAERAVPVDGHVHVAEPRRSEQVYGLGNDRIQTEHLPQHP